MYKTDIQNDYSGAKNVADFIMDNGLENNIIVADDAWAALAVLPYLPDESRLYDKKCGRFFRHYVYDSCFKQTEGFDLAKSIPAVKETFPR